MDGESTCYLCTSPRKRSVADDLSARYPKLPPHLAVHDSHSGVPVRDPSPSLGLREHTDEALRELLGRC